MAQADDSDSLDSDPNTIYNWDVQNSLYLIMDHSYGLLIW